MSVRWLVGRSGCHNFPNGQEATLPCSYRRNTRFLLCFFSQCCCTNNLGKNKASPFLVLQSSCVLAFQEIHSYSVLCGQGLALCIPCLEFYLLEYSRLHRFKPNHYLYRFSITIARSEFMTDHRFSNLP